MTTNQGSPHQPRTIKASEFKAKCLKLMDEVAESGEEIVIIKNGRPVARLVRYQTRFEKFFGADEGKLEIHGDILSPLDVDWESGIDPKGVLFP